MAVKQKMPTPLQKEWAKQMKRIERALQRAEEAGLQYEYGYTPIKLPKQVTWKNVGKLKKIKPKQLYKGMQYVDELTGEILTGYTGYRVARARQGKMQYPKGYEPHIEEATEDNTMSNSTFNYEVIRIFRESIDRAALEGSTNSKTGKVQQNRTTKSHNMITEWLDTLINKYGEDDVATMIMDGTSAGLIVTPELMYNPDHMKDFLGQLILYLPEVGDFTIEQMSEILEEQYFEEDD